MEWGDVLKIDYGVSECAASHVAALRWCDGGSVSLGLIQLKVRGGMANFMQLSVKLVGHFFFSVEHTIKFLIFTTSHFVVHEGDVASVGEAATFCVTNSTLLRAVSLQY